MSAHEIVTLAVASGATFALALLSAVAGFGGGVLLLPVFTAAVRAAVRGADPDADAAVEQRLPGLAQPA